MKNTAKVIKSRIKNPLQTVREVAKETWLDFSTVAKLDKEIPQITTKSEIILEICNLDINLVKKWLVELDRRFSNTEEIKLIRPTEISQVIKDSSWRYQIFKWKATDENWGLKDLSTILAEIQWQKENN